MIEPEDDLPARRPRWIVRAVAILASLLLLSNLARLVPSSAPDPSPPTTTTPLPTLSPSGTPSVPRPLADMPPEIRQVAKAVEQIRGLRFLEPVEVQLVTQAELDKRLSALVREVIDVKEIARTERTWKLLGLLDQDKDLLKAILDLNTGGVAGFYDDETGELLVETTDTGTLSPAARYYVAHELTHALTDQHFGLDPIRSEAGGKADAATAYRALVEGDAVIVAQQYIASYSSSEIASLQREIGAQEEGSLAGVPGAMLRAFSFPYRAGEVFVRSLLDKGGFRRVDRAYRLPPRSTAEILHPGLFRAPAPERLPLRRLPKGWNGLESSAFGEFDLAVVLERDPASPAVPRGQADEAAEGWSAGRSRTSGDGSATVVEIELAFKNASESQEAFDAFDRYLRSLAGASQEAFAKNAWTGWSGDAASGALLRQAGRLSVVVATDQRALSLYVER